MKNIINIIDNPAIEMVRGFHSNGIHCGLKNENKLDLGVVYSDDQATAYALYTSNKFQAAPLIVCKKHLVDNKAQVLVVNSKIANACTGQEGIDNAEKVCEEAAKIFNVKQTDVISMSTGVIGEHLPVKKIKDGLKNLKPDIKKPNDNNFSKAIMTTDNFMKIYGVKVNIGDTDYSIVGTCKGAGMISPNMATMLSFIFTDAKIKDDLLKKAFINSVSRSFNSITVDGDMSTNDTAIIFSSSLCENKTINTASSQEYINFCKALDEVTVNLAKSIVRDGEGATKLIEINVTGAKTTNDAKVAGLAVANSKLVKTAFFGEDANWGRIVCAVGYSGASFDPEALVLSVDDIVLFRNGKKTNYNEENAKKVLQKKEIKVNIDLKSGDKSWKLWTCDLTYDYIKINASYRT